MSLYTPGKRAKSYACVVPVADLKGAMGGLWRLGRVLGVKAVLVEVSTVSMVSSIDIYSCDDMLQCAEVVESGNTGSSSPSAPGVEGRTFRTSGACTRIPRPR